MTVLRTYYIEEVNDHIACITVERLYPGGKAGRVREYNAVHSPLREASRASRLNAMATAAKRGYLITYHKADAGYTEYTDSLYGVPKESTDRKREERE